MGKLSAERFAGCPRAAKKEQAELKASVDALRPISQTAESEAATVQRLLKIKKKYTEPMELPPAILREFVNKIVVHAPPKRGAFFIWPLPERLPSELNEILNCAPPA